MIFMGVSHASLRGFLTKAQRPGGGTPKETECGTPPARRLGAVSVGLRYYRGIAMGVTICRVPPLWNRIHWGARGSCSLFLAGWRLVTFG